MKTKEGIPMAEQMTAAIWTVNMAELTGCDETIWVRKDTVLPTAEAGGHMLELSFPDTARREQLMLLLRGGMAGQVMYAVPIMPGLRAPWGVPGVLLTDDPGAARWFAALPGSCDDTALNSGRPYLQILHLSHSHGSGMALLPEEHTLWALGADLPSLCRAIALGMGSAEGRWGDWLAVPMEVRGGTGILNPEGQPHWLQIGPDGALWAVDPWADAAPAAGLAALAAPAGCSPGRTDWNTLVLCAAMAALRGGRLSMEGWYYAGIAHYLNQWGHEQDIVPRPPVCVIGRAGELGGAVPADNAAPAEYGPALTQQAAALQQRLAQPDAGPLETTLAQRLAQLAKK